MTAQVSLIVAGNGPVRFRPARRRDEVIGLAGFSAACILALVLFAAAPAGLAQDTPPLNIIQPGGMPGLPVMTSIQPSAGGVQLTWYGIYGYYQLYEKVGSLGAAWQPVGGPNLNNSAFVTPFYNNAFFRVSGPSPNYIGSQACAQCHSTTHSTVALTAHAGAFTDALFVSNGGQNNAACFPCHTVGAGLPTGFVSLAATPKLAGVQCENCHGPAANHAANPNDFTAIPRVEASSAVCGGCHNLQYYPAQFTNALPYHFPRYEEWNASPHQSVTATVKSNFTGNLGASVYIPACGPCHSGTVREAVLDNYTLPDGYQSASLGITCATCHESHTPVAHVNALNGLFTNTLDGFVVTNNLLGAAYTNQLRNPYASTYDYYLRTNDVFASKYDPNVNVCGQCHNDLGASWSDTASPPHGSPQYNMLLGTVGAYGTNLQPNQPGAHAYLEQQCVTCHMQSSAYAGPAKPAVTGHHFEVESYQACAACHGSAANAENLATFLELDLNMEMQSVATALNQWAVSTNTVAKFFGGTNYGLSAWEYTSYPKTPGSSIILTNNINQTLIPDAIKQARFNLYLVENDGSGGVHNPFYFLDLLAYASQFVQQSQ